ncbi:pterocarpan synthase 1-like [Curcuma longa]|uniref:pterocarpan synthase 1-like n=1 Tax=Curcuma longa TaxID=136217 RepID=UPI003D9F822B
MAYYCSCKPSLLFLLFLISATAQARDTVTTHLHFFFHEEYSGPNATVITVVNSTTSNPGGFGSIAVADNDLREGSSLDSKLIGRAQGIAPVVSQSGQMTWLGLFNFVFTEGEYNGSSLTVVGLATLEAVTERSIIGGTGKFRMARGYAIHTLLSGVPEGRFIVEFDAYVEH